MTTAQKATWIWYPGDFEIWLGNKFNNRRTERGAMFPPFWKQDSHYPTVEFTTTVDLERDEDISITAEGQYNLAVDGKLQTTASIPKGQHRLSIKVWNQATPPALYVSGRTIHTSGAWLATYEDKIWIDENGQAHGSGIYVPAGSRHFDAPETPPSQYRLERRELRPVGQERTGNGRTLYDFGREVFGYLRLSGQEGCLDVYYGESREEALDAQHCETLDHLCPGHREPGSKAFRYVCVEHVQDTGARYDDVWMEFKYAPFDAQRSGSFSCSDELLNRIWQTAAYTLELTTQEFFMDGIKRDRWVWSGDAIQSYLMNYYLHFDAECVKRTIRQLRGKDPVTAHVNTIMDYTFYWFKSIADYYDYTADADFVSEMYPRMVTLMDYVLGRTNREGFAEGQPDDWIFVDWVDFPMHKRGVLSFEQILFIKALETMGRCAALLGHDTDAHDYQDRAARLHTLLDQTFWSSDAHGFLHAVEDGRMNRQVTKFPNMFAILYGLADRQQQGDIMEHVMLNPGIPAITTPYMRFYELEALCMAGHHEHVLQEMRNYWGGMLHEGATTFWEKYNPGERGTEHLAMYGRPYGKSLCHAWGASPIYLLGRYCLGIRPTKPGYAEFEVRPCLGGLEWMEGTVPTPQGLIHVRMDRHQVTVTSTHDEGWLHMGGQRHHVEPGKELVVRIL